MTGCDLSIRFSNENDLHNNGVEAPESIRLKAYSSAEYYAVNNVPYEWGGDYYIEPRSMGVDCSGLIISNYKYALKGTGYSLPFSDSTAHDMYQYYSNPVNYPQKGDLVFWKNSSGRVYHIALLEGISGGKVYFIDASTNEGKVTYRFDYLSNISTIKRMLLK